MVVLKIVLEIVFIIVLIGLVVACGCYAVGAAAKLSSKIYDNDSGLRTAHNLLTWASVIAWITVGLGVLVVILLVAVVIFFSPEIAAAAAEVTLETATAAAGTAKKHQSTILMLINVALWLCIGALVIFTAVLGTFCTIAAYNIIKSQNYRQVKNSFSDAVYGAVFGFVGLVIVSIYVFYKLYEHFKEEKITKKTKQEEESAEEKHKELVEQLNEKYAESQSKKPVPKST